MRQIQYDYIKQRDFQTSGNLFQKFLVGDRFVDASILNFNGIWWLFVGVEPTEGEACNLLRLYYADSLFGNWVEHPMSPVVNNNLEISRPAGRIRQIGNQPIRFAQDCTVTYGPPTLPACCHAGNVAGFCAICGRGSGSWETPVLLKPLESAVVWPIPSTLKVHSPTSPR